MWVCSLTASLGYKAHSYAFCSETLPQNQRNA
uniref:Uncharacterized protein n=1 Tax=Anguilla anguilla TaxID=7936 RepID=A0A0E9T6I8_ANGAN